MKPQPFPRRALAVRARSASLRGRQGGFTLLESLVAALLFVLGVLSLVTALARTTSYNNDAQFRSIASQEATRLLNEIFAAVTAGQATAPGVVTALATFSYQAPVAAVPPAVAVPLPACNFANGQSANILNPLVTAWVQRLTNPPTGTVAILPGMTAAMQQVVVGANNSVTVTLCWQGPKDVVPRQYVQTGYVNL
jgi:type IV pilus assembly protein PilV